MTQPGQYAPSSLELQARALGQRHSKTQAEREDIAKACDALILQYEQQGGRYALRWLERHATLAHSSAVSYRDAGYALRLGIRAGQGVTALAIMGRYLRAGKTLVEAQATYDDAEKRKAAAADAGIGIGKVKYPTALTGEVANSYASLATSLSDAGLPQQDVAEMTVTMTRLAKLNMSPAALALVEAGDGTHLYDVPLPPQNVRSDFYSWLARQPCAVCADPGVQIHHLRVFDIRDQPGGRRFKFDQQKELVMPLCLRHHSTARDAAHQGGQDEWSTRHFGRPDAVYVLAARYLSEWAQETGVLRGGKV